MDTAWSAEKAMHILIISEMDVMRAGIRSMLLDSHGLPVDCFVSESANPQQLTLSRASTLDLILFDAPSPHLREMVFNMHLVKAKAPTTPLLVMCQPPSPQLISDLLLHGAAGVLPRSSTRWQILAALKLVLSGGAYIPSLPTGPFQPGVIERRGSPVRSSVMDHELTPRQVSVLDLLLAGRSNKEIARTLDLSIGTVKNYVSGLLRTVHATNRTEAIASFSHSAAFMHHAVKEDAVEGRVLGDR